MIITAIVYSTEDESQVKVTCSDEPTTMFVPWGEDGALCQTWHKQVILDWLAVPNTIGAWTDPVDYMALLRQTRDQKLNEMDWRVMRNYTQVAHSETPTDDGTKMAAIYQYQKDLRDFPANNPITTKAQYDALVWPTKPA